MIIFTILYFFGAIIFMVAILLTIYSGIIGAPFFKTPAKAIVEALKKAQIKPGDKFYDLGAGDGKVLAIVDKEFGANCTGFELSPIFFVLAKSRLFFGGAKNSKIYCRNFYKQNLSDADAVFCFLLPRTMEKLRPKFEEELKPEAKVISYAFKIKDWQPKMIVSGYSGKIYIYERPSRQVKLIVKNSTSNKIVMGAQIVLSGIVNQSIISSRRVSVAVPGIGTLFINITKTGYIDWQSQLEIQ